jgi:hypothetical protein
VNGYKHPYEANTKPWSSGWTSAQQAEIRAIMAESGGLISWGLDYNPGWRDAMHFDVTRGKTAAQVKAFINSITPPPPDPHNQEEIVARLVQIKEDGRIMFLSDLLFQHVPNMERAKALAQVYGAWLPIGIQDAQRLQDQVNENITSNAANLKGQGL